MPFNMKIGDAGEAFFVFETDEDVPEDLITSPILLPTHPEAETSAQGATITGLTNDEDRVSRQNVKPEAPDLGREGARPRLTSEPEFFDLDGGPTPRPSHDITQYTRADAPTSEDGRTPSMVQQDERVDELLEDHRKRDVKSPAVDYREGLSIHTLIRQRLRPQFIDVALDIEGYHAAEQTPRNSFAFPSLAEHSMVFSCLSN